MICDSAMEMIERLCLEAEREQSAGDDRVAELLWQIAEDFGKEASRKALQEIDNA